MKKKICVIDGHGGGIGATLIKYIRQVHEDRLDLIAVGTNAIATAGMLKAGAQKGGSGEPLPHLAMAIAEKKLTEVLNHA